MRVHSVSPGSIMHMAVSAPSKTKHPGLLTCTAISLLYLLHLCHSLEPCKRASFLSWGEEKGHKRSLTSYKFSPVCISIFCSNYHCQACQSATCWLVSTGSLTSSLISRDSSPFLPSCSKLTPESALYTCYLLPPHFLDSHKKAVSELQSPHNISRKSEVKC